jgi:hypothetical protein
MELRFSTLCLGGLAFGCLLLASTDSRAGSGPSSFAYCFTTPGTSMCQGNMAGFLNASDPDAYAGFQTNPNSFGAFLDGQDFSCTVSSTLYPDVLAHWPQTTSFRGLFFINWDPDGNCSNLSFFNSSTYQ